ncbi:MAG: lipoate protein ligase C-terminal domain-containing protein [Nanobdellota archaeon]
MEKFEMKHIDHKAKNGKLLRIDADINKKINFIRITGDFFIHPESALEEIEKSLEGVSLENVEKVLQTFIESKNIQIIGFKPSDLAEALRK